MSSLTDRYVYAVTRRLPQDNRDDVARELRATIEDTIDARTDDGAPRDVAERDALLALGDPEQLAANYRGRPRYLIGPDMYPHFLRLLRLLLVIVPTVAGSARALAFAVEGADTVGDLTVGEVVVGIAGAAATAALHVCFWVTLSFAIAEWAGATEDLRDRTWTLDNLEEEPRKRQIGYGDSAVEFFAILTFLVVLVLNINPLVSALDSTRVPLFGPVPEVARLSLIGLLVALLALEIVKLVRGWWSYPLAAANAVVDGSIATIVAWLLIDDRLITESTRTAIGQGVPWEAVTVSLRVTAIVIVTITLWDIARSFHLARQAQSQRV